MHDDVHGTAVVGARGDHRRLRAARASARRRQTIGQIGLGAAGFGIARLAQRRAARSAVLATDPDPLAQTHADANGIEITDFETVMARAPTSSSRRPASPG